MASHPGHYFSSVCLSRLLGMRVEDAHGSVFGVLKDLYALNEEHPKIVAAQVKTSKGMVTIDWAAFTINEDDHRYELVCMRHAEVLVPVNAISLNRHVLDKQIVDINNKKVVRVNDVRLAFLSGGVFPVAVDVGMSGLLRRLGVVEPMNWLFAKFDRAIPSRLILWSNIGVLPIPGRSIKLSTSFSKLNTMHPSELSDIIEDLDTKTGAALFSQLDNETAADVLEEMEDEVKLEILEDLPIQRAADVLEMMPSDEVADILDDLDEKKSEELLCEMNQEAADDVRELMEYAEGTVGSLMTTEFLSFNDQSTPEQILALLREQKPESDSIYSIYVVDHRARLIGEMSLGQLVISDLDKPLSALMNKRFLHVYDTDSIDDLMQLVSKYSPLAVPVVSHDMKLLGAIVIDDIVYQVLRRKRPKMG